VKRLDLRSPTERAGRLLAVAALAYMLAACTWLQAHRVYPCWPRTPSPGDDCGCPAGTYWDDDARLCAAPQPDDEGTVVGKARDAGADR
jgi:hypothetical protein